MGACDCLESFDSCFMMNRENVEKQNVWLHFGYKNLIYI